MSYDMITGAKLEIIEGLALVKEPRPIFYIELFLKEIVSLIISSYGNK